MKHIIYSIILIFILFGSSLNATIIYVNTNAQAGLEDGTSWENAFPDLQDALASAERGDQIWVAQGTYYPTDIDSLREISFVLPEGVALFGGFIGTEENFEERDWENNNTILSGDIGVIGDSLDNVYTVVIVSVLETDSTRILDGFSIIEGNGDLPINQGTFDGPEKNGGGIYLEGDASTENARPIFRNCIFKENFARSGGGFYMKGDETTFEVTHPIIEDCQFIQNTSRRGGAIYRIGGGNHFDIEIKNCLFKGNKSINSGGAIFYGNFAGSQFFILNNCSFEENEAVAVGGAISYDDFNFNSGIQIIDCNFYMNKSNIEASCIFALSFDSKANILIDNCDFVENEGLGVIHIWGDFNFTTNATIQNSKFINNCFNSPINIFYEAEAQINNCIFHQNNSSGGAGLLSVLSSNNSITIDILNCAIVNNEITFSNEENVQGIFGLSDTDLTINCKNSIFLNNTKTSTGNLYLPKDEVTITFDNCLIDLPNCSAISPIPPICQNNLYNLDPLFADTAANDFRLLPCSPAINAGDTSIINQLGILTDIDDNPRVSEGLVDLGPYERLPAQISVDTILPVSCGAAANGSVEFVLSDFCEPVEIEWSDDENSGMGSQNLFGGDYQFTLTDAVGRVVQTSASIPVLPELEVQTQATAIACPEGIGGTISAMPEGGTAPFSFEWSNGMTATTIENLPVGNYELTITDANDCTAISSAEVNTEGLFGIGINATAISCHDSEDGTAAVTPMGGSAPFLYNWVNGETDSLIQNLVGGDYSVTITDANGCEDELNFTMLPPEPIDLDLAAENVACFGDNSGSAMAMASGGTDPLQYFWSNGQTAPNLENLPAGNYGITILDAKDCEQTGSIEITEPTELTAEIGSEDISCFGEMSGEIWAMPSGGTPPFQYLWSNGSEDSLIQDLVAGIFEVTILDENNCEILEMTEIFQPDSLHLEMEVTNASEATATDGSISQIEISGASPPFEYLWSNGETSENLENVAPDFYQLTVTDANECEWFFEFEVSFLDGIFDISQSLDFQLFPNPVAEKLTLILNYSEKEGQDFQIQMIDLLGKVIWEEKAVLENGKLEKEISVEDLPSGAYFLKISGRDGFGVRQFVRK